MKAMTALTPEQRRALRIAPQDRGPAVPSEETAAQIAAEKTVRSGPPPLRPHNVPLTRSNETIAGALRRINRCDPNRAVESGDPERLLRLKAHEAKNARR